MLGKHKIHFSRMIAILAVGALIISLVPILYSAQYAHQLSDDFKYSDKVHVAIDNDEGLFEVIKASFAEVHEIYYSWQGTYSAVFLFSIQPGAFSDNLYFLTTWILLFWLCFSTFLLIQTIIVKWLKMRLSYAIVIASLVLFCEIQFIPNKAQAFFWWNGAIYYTFFFSLSLIFFASIIRLLLEENKHHRVGCAITASVLAVIIGGGNYSTALTTLVIVVLATGMLLIKKQKGAAIFLVLSLILLTSMIVSIIAPGNSIRAQTDAPTEKLSAIESIIQSVFYSVVFIGNWTDLQQIAVFVFITPFLYMATKNAKLSFKYPVLMSLGAFLVFATQLTPPLFALNSVGAGRQVDMYYYAYYLLFLFIIFYVCGWIRNKGVIKMGIYANGGVSILGFTRPYYWRSCFLQGVLSIPSTI